MQSQGISSYITTNATTTLRNIPVGGVLRRLIIGNPGSAWVIDVYDNTAGSGTLLASFNPTAMGYIACDLQYSQGLTVVTSGTTPGKLTVVYT